jgi:hypothetical protein
MGRSPAIYVLVSLLLLAPCHWQPRLQAGDLSSRIDNSWLARLIEAAGHGVVIRAVKEDVPCGSANWRAGQNRRPNT